MSLFYVFPKIYWGPTSQSVLQASKRMPSPLWPTRLASPPSPRPTHTRLSSVSARVASASAARWLTGLFTAIQTLANMPACCPVIPEADEIGSPLRHLLYGKRTGIYRIIFDIQEDSEEGPRVRVLRIWHGVRAAITAEDIETER